MSSSLEVWPSSSKAQGSEVLLQQSAGTGLERLQFRAHLLVKGGYGKGESERAAAVLYDWKCLTDQGELPLMVHEPEPNPKRYGLTQLERTMFSVACVPHVTSPAQVWTSATPSGALECTPLSGPATKCVFLPLRLPRSGGEMWHPLRHGDTLQGELCIRQVPTGVLAGQRFHLSLHEPFEVLPGTAFQLGGATNDGAIVVVSACATVQDDVVQAAQGESHPIPSMHPVPMKFAEPMVRVPTVPGELKIPPAVGPEMGTMVSAPTVQGEFKSDNEAAVGPEMGKSGDCNLKTITEMSQEMKSQQPLHGVDANYHRDKESQYWYSAIPLPCVEPIDPLLYPHENEDEIEPELEHRRLALLAAVREQETAHARELQAGKAELAELSGATLAQMNKSILCLEETLCGRVASHEAFESEGPQNRDLYLKKVEAAETESVLQTRIVPLTEVVAHLPDWREALGCELDILVSEHRACVIRTEDEVRQMESDPYLEIVRVPGKIVAAVKPPNRKRARLVAFGNFLYQAKGRGSPSLNRRDLYAAGLDVYSMRCQIAIGAYRRWRCASLDVKTACLTAPLQPPKTASERKRKVSVRAPRVMSMCNLLPANSWLEVQGALYGLRESPSSWGVFRDEKLRTLTWTGEDGRPKHLVQCTSDVSLWLVKDSESGKCIGTLGVYVDDLMFWAEPIELDKILLAVQGLAGVCGPGGGTYVLWS